MILLLISLVSAAAVTWLLLRAAAAALADEELLFRGPDAAGGLLLRPIPRRRPSAMQGFAAGLLAFAALWYSQGLAPKDLVLAVPFQQLALLLPLAALLAWQRVDLRHTFGLRLPRAIRWPLPAIGGLLLGAGLFIVAAAVTLAIRGSHLSSSARELAERIVALIESQPWLLSWALIAILPAISEEIFFRGWLLAAFAGNRPSPRRATVAILIQAAVFAGFHLLPERMPQTFILGLVLGWLTLATGSILPAVLAHLAHNSVPLVLVALPTGMRPAWLSAIPAACPAGWSPSRPSRRSSASGSWPSPAAPHWHPAHKSPPARAGGTAGRWARAASGSPNNSRTTQSPFWGSQKPRGLQQPSQTHASRGDCGPREQFPAPGILKRPHPARGKPVPSRGTLAPASCLRFAR